MINMFGNPEDRYNNQGEYQRNMRVGQCINLAQNHVLREYEQGTKIIPSEEMEARMISRAHFYWNIIDRLVVELQKAEVLAKAQADKYYKKDTQPKNTHNTKQNIPTF